MMNKTNTTATATVNTTAKAPKLTYASACQMVLDVATGKTDASVLTAEVLEKAEKAIESFQKKPAKDGERKLTKNQQANLGLKELILDQMVDGERYTIKNMTDNFKLGIDGISIQKVSALVKQLKDSGAVTRIEEKGVAYFFKTVATEEVEETEEE